MKPVYLIASLFLLVGCILPSASAQTFYLKLVEVSNTPTTYEVEVQMALSSDASLGSSNLQFTFDESFIDAPTFVSTTLTAPIYAVGVTEPNPGLASFNIFLQVPGFGDAIAVFPAFTSLGNISFTKQGGPAADLAWAYSGGSTLTVVFLQDESTQIFSATPSSDLQGLSPSSGLPTEMLYFQANWQDTEQHASLVSWATETEIQSSHFEIQRSWDAIQFEPIGTVEAAGNSTDPKYYQFVDAELARMDAGDVVYYRLRDVDLYGEDSISDICSLTKNVFEPSKIRVFPSPFESELSLYLHGQSWLEQNLEIQLTGATGKVIRQFELINYQSNSIQLSNLNDLDPGMYFLSVRQLGSQHWETVKLLKL
ncbi:MAG: T9SS type A sorting domain-containing protein [Bacteroidota bacterium]